MNNIKRYEERFKSIIDKFELLSEDFTSEEIADAYRQFADEDKGLAVFDGISKVCLKKQLLRMFEE